MKQTDIKYTINSKYYIEIRERKCHNTFRLRLFNSNKERLNEICCTRDKYGYNMQRLIDQANELEMHYVMRNKMTNELIIVSHDAHHAYNMIVYVVDHMGPYEECLEYCENIIGYK
jgi:hypothetical protein